jgi:glycosyltransferase involved in cell wall biosynthesis
MADLWRLAQAVRATPADLLHIQHAAGTYGFHRAIFLLPLVLWAIGDRRPIVTTIHEYGWWEWQPVGMPPRLLEWLKVAGQQRGWWDREDGFLLTHSRAIVTTNANATTVIQQRLPNLTSRVQEIPIAANVAIVPMERTVARQHLRQSCHWSEAAIVLVFFGFLHPVKGLEILLTAFQSVVQQQPEARLLLLGGVESLALPKDAADRYWQQLQQQVSALNLTQHVHFTGYVNAQLASAYLQGCDLGVLPFHPGVTLKSGSLLTLLAHGLPTIATTSQPPEPALNCDRLVPIPARDAEALTQAMLMLLQDQTRRDRLAAAGQEFVQRFSWDAIAQKHLEIYRQVLGERNPELSESSMK